jgi:hypothetical protein
MGVEGGTAHVGGIDDVLHRDPAVAFLREKLIEGLKNGISGFLLSTIHKNLPNKCRNLFHNAQTKTIVRCAWAERVV